MKTTLKELPKNIKFATHNSLNEDIILGEYLIALLIHNGASFNQILDSTDEIEDKREREYVRAIMRKIISQFICLNPEYSEFLK